MINFRLNVREVWIVRKPIPEKYQISKKLFKDIRPKNVKMYNPGDMGFLKPGEIKAGAKGEIA